MDETYLDLLVCLFRVLFSGFCLAFLFSGILLIFGVWVLKVYRFLHREQKMEVFDFIVYQLSLMTFVVMFYATIPLIVSFLTQKTSNPKFSFPGQWFLTSNPKAFFASFALWVLFLIDFSVARIRNRYAYEFLEEEEEKEKEDVALFG